MREQISEQRPSRIWPRDLRFVPMRQRRRRCTGGRRGRRRDRRRDRGEGEEGGGFGEEDREGEEEEEEDDGGGLEGDEAVDGGAAFQEGVGVGGDDELVSEGDEEAEN